ncbi:YveK family protein [Nonomuraea rhizosphaerae]|uniref:YveK family protein n=1 Tax=Nonomuraea rhizosphaerae TaxID=2665663 RepID=UPI001C60093F|nr:Wzz/FepE/Etk N-terminal domain-containing protein [Nonomuraea rhizosphaerae]
MTLTPDFPGRRSGTDLAEHLSLLRRRWLLFVGCLLAGGTTGLALMRLTPPVYTATTQVLVAPVGVQDQGNQVTNRQREPLNLDTEAQIAQSSVVAAKAAKELGTATPEPVDVSVPPNSAVLWISVTAADPAVAAAHSRAYAEAYLTNRTESAQATMTAQQKATLVKLRQVNTALDGVIKQLAGLRRGTIEHSIAVHRQSVLNRQAYSLTLKYDALKTVAVTPGSVISQATTPTRPSSPSLPLYLGTGLMIGLFLGAAAAYGRDRLDTRLRTVADVERLTGLPVLADLSGPHERGVPHDLAAAVVAACPGKRLLVRAIPPELGATPVAVPLARVAPLSLLTGADVGDLARADAALLLVGLGRATSVQAAAVVRGLSRHDIPIIGVVTTTDLNPAPMLAPEPRPGTPLGKLVASVELEAGPSPETTPMPMIRPPGKSA